MGNLGCQSLNISQVNIKGWEASPSLICLFLSGVLTVAMGKSSARTLGPISGDISMPVRDAGITLMLKCSSMETNHFLYLYVFWGVFLAIFFFIGRTCLVIQQMFAIHHESGPVLTASAQRELIRDIYLVSLHF